jgi:hypothetical protein
MTIDVTGAPAGRVQISSLVYARHTLWAPGEAWGARRLGRSAA